MPRSGITATGEHASRFHTPSVILSGAKDPRAKHVKTPEGRPVLPAGSGFAEGFFPSVRMTGVCYSELHNVVDMVT